MILLWPLRFRAVPMTAWLLAMQVVPEQLRPPRLPGQRRRRSCGISRAAYRDFSYYIITVTGVGNWQTTGITYSISSGLVGAKRPLILGPLKLIMGLTLAGAICPLRLMGRHRPALRFFYRGQLRAYLHSFLRRLFCVLRRWNPDLHQRKLWYLFPILQYAVLSCKRRLERLGRL